MNQSVAPEAQREHQQQSKSDHTPGVCHNTIIADTEAELFQGWGHLDQLWHQAGRHRDLLYQLQREVDEYRSQGCTDQTFDTADHGHGDHQAHPADDQFAGCNEAD